MTKMIDSTGTGEPIRVNINRDYLARAMRLGLREVNLTGEKTAIIGFDAQRQYVWMPLDSEAAISAAEDAIRIESWPTRQTRRDRPPRSQTPHLQYARIAQKLNCPRNIRLLTGKGVVQPVSAAITTSGPDEIGRFQRLGKSPEHNPLNGTHKRLRYVATRRPGSYDTKG